MTGYPIVDAGMRELWTTGWMAQNVRMVAAIMLCEHLNINWVEGERWFHHTLVDADLAINAMMWQNAGKGGLDQWNFTMDAGSSGKNQDPTGSYVRRWCPELAKLPLKFLHKPWEAPEDVLHDAGVKLGTSYPARIVVNLKAASKVSGDAIRQQRKRTAEDWSNNQGYDLILLPRGSTVAHDGQKFRVFTKPEFRNAAGSSGDGGWNRGGRGGERGWDATWEEPDYSTRPASTRGKGRGKGRVRGRRRVFARPWPGLLKSALLAGAWIGGWRKRQTTATSSLPSLPIRPCWTSTCEHRVADARASCKVTARAMHARPVKELLLHTSWLPR